MYFTPSDSVALRSNVVSPLQRRDREVGGFDGARGRVCLCECTDTCGECVGVCMAGACEASGGRSTTPEHRIVEIEGDGCHRVRVRVLRGEKSDPARQR